MKVQLNPKIVIRNETDADVERDSRGDRCRV